MLQEGQVLPLGGDRTVAVDVRVVAATNRDVAELVTSGQLRRDLYARLRGYEVRMPPLHARLEDLGLLIAALLARLSPGAPARLSRAAARALFAYAWPFNIRELEHTLGAALAVARDKIGLDALPASLRDPAAPLSAGDRDRLVALVAKHGGNLSAVARELATSRSQVRRLLARHGVASHEVKGR